MIPVPKLNRWTRARTAFYDRSFLAADPAFVNAHITLLGPWVQAPTEDDVAKVRSIAADTPPFDFVLEEIAAFPGGVIYLAPTPSEPFVALTERLCATFGDYPPYAGAFEQVVPHLTLDQIGTEVSVESVRASVGHLIPVRAHASRIDLQWWENDGCRLMNSWALGS